jgi:nucleotide-binding universal stress UspA family protein
MARGNRAGSNQILLMLMEENRMKIVVAYDGSEIADAAIGALSRAGLPSRAHAVVLAVDDGGLHPAEHRADDDAGADPQITTRAERQETWALARAMEVASLGCDKVQALFPEWEVEAEGAAGSPTWGILAKTDTWIPDLVVVGSHGRSLLGRLFLGSVSQMIATEARCSVHVARGRIGQGADPVRLVIGLDGSLDSLAAVDVVISRRWPEGSAAMIVAATDHSQPRVAPPSGTQMPPAFEGIAAEHESRLAELADRSVKRLIDAGLVGDVVFVKGRPAHALVERADSWGAECIFVGARGVSLRDRVRLGGVSASVAARAHCSVEIVRRNDPHRGA